MYSDSISRQSDLIEVIQGRLYVSWDFHVSWDELIFWMLWGGPLLLLRWNPISCEFIQETKWVISWYTMILVCFTTFGFQPTYPNLRSDVRVTRSLLLCSQVIGSFILCKQYQYLKKKYHNTLNMVPVKWSDDILEFWGSGLLWHLPFFSYARAKVSVLGDPEMSRIMK